MKDLENKLKSIPPRQPSPDYYQRVLDQKPISQKPKTKTHQLSHNRSDVFLYRNRREHL